MTIRILVLIMLLPTMLAMPDKKESDKISVVCVEAFRHYGGKIFVFKSEYLLPSNYKEALLYGDKLRRKRVWIEIYVATPWGIKLYAIINGKVIPAQAERYEFGGINKDLFKEQP